MARMVRMVRTCPDGPDGPHARGALTTRAACGPAHTLRGMRCMLAIPARYPP